MKSFLFIVAIISVSFHDSGKPSVVNSLKKHHSGKEYLSHAISPNTDRSEELSGQPTYTNKNLQVARHRIQLLAHFNTVLSKNLRATRYELIAGMH